MVWEFQMPTIPTTQLIRIPAIYRPPNCCRYRLYRPPNWSRYRLYRPPNWSRYRLSPAIPTTQLIQIPAIYQQTSWSRYRLYTDNPADPDTGYWLTTQLLQISATDWPPSWSRCLLLTDHPADPDAGYWLTTQLIRLLFVLVMQQLASFLLSPHGAATVASPPPLSARARNRFPTRCVRAWGGGEFCSADSGSFAIIW